MRKIFNYVLANILCSGALVSAATLGVDWGGQYSTGVSGLNAGLGSYTTATGDYTFDAISDAAYLLSYGTVFSPSADSRYVAPTGKTGPLYTGLQLVNHSSSTPPSEAGIFKWSGSTNPNELNKTNPTNGGSDPMSMSVAYYAQKADFLNGLDAVSAVGFADEVDGASVTISNLRNKNSGEATIAFIVQEGSSWYATVATTRATSGSDWSGTLTLNPYGADWYAFDPSSNQFLDIANLGTAKAGSTFQDIRAFGVSGQITGYHGTVANSQKLDFSMFSTRFIEIPIELPERAVDFGGNYVEDSSNSTKVVCLRNGDFDFDGLDDDRASLVSFGQPFTPPDSDFWVDLPSQSNGKIYHGLSVAVINKQNIDPAEPMDRLGNNPGGDRFQMGNVKIAGESMSLAVAIYWSAVDFLNGGVSAPLADEAGSMSVNLASSGAKPSVRFLVQAGGSWYLSAESSGGDFSINGAAANWYAFDPSANALFWDETSPGPAVAGSSLGEITAAGVYGQTDDGYTGTDGSLFGMDGLQISLAATEAPSTLASNGFFEHLTDAEVTQIRADLDVQKRLFFERQAGDILDPRPRDPNWDPSRGVFTRFWCQDICTFAMKSFQLDETLTEANDALVEMCQFHLNETDRITMYEIHSFPSIFDTLVTMCIKFGPNGSDSPGLMTQSTYDKILETMFELAKVRSKITETEMDVSQTWDIYDSENHHAQGWYGSWAFSLLLKDDPTYASQTYDDGSTPQQHYDAWSAYLIEYLRQRIQKGMLIEINSNSYVTATLKCVVGVYDYSENQTLRQCASDFLDVYWTLWAQSEVDGVLAGAKARSYPASNQQGKNSLFRTAWYVTGVGDPRYLHISMVPFVTTGWTPPDLVFDMIYSPSGRATYESFERRMGLLRAPLEVFGPLNYLYPVNYDFGGIVRYLWHTPEFSMSSLLFDPLPKTDWADISTQNRWWGVVFKGHPDARIYPFAGLDVDAADTTTVNSHWTVQAKGTMISQELLAAYHQDSNGFRVWFAANGLTAPEESGGWIFVQSEGAYAAVKAVGSAYTWNSKANGSWIKLTTRYAPVIIEAAPANEYVDFDAFKSAIQALNLDTSTPGQLHYTGLSGDAFVFHTDQSARNEINGKPIDLAPAATYRSPFIQSSEDGAEITLRCFDKSKIISLGDAPFYDTSATFALWHFNEENPSGTFLDTSTAAGTVANAVVHSQSSSSVSLINDGKFGKAIRCDDQAGNQYVMTTSSHWPVDQGNFRYQGWFRLNAGEAGGHLFHMYDQIYLSVSTTQASFIINKSGVGADTSSDNRVEISAALPSTNDWQYLDAFYDGETIRLTTSAETVSEDGLGPFVPNVRSMTVGASKNANNFVGDMDEIRISIPAMQLAVADPNDPFDFDGDGMLDSWEVENFGGYRYATPLSDSDGDASVNLEEFMAGTDPWDPSSRFAISALSTESISWQAVEGKTYRVLSTVDLTEAWGIEATGLPGDPPESSYFFSTEPNQQFFKIEVE